MHVRDLVLEHALHELVLLDRVQAREPGRLDVALVHGPAAALRSARAEFGPRRTRGRRARARRSFAEGRGARTETSSTATSTAPSSALSFPSICSDGVDRAAASWSWCGRRAAVRAAVRAVCRSVNASIVLERYAWDRVLLVRRERRRRRQLLLRQGDRVDGVATLTKLVVGRGPSRRHGREGSRDGRGDRPPGER